MGSREEIISKIKATRELKNLEIEVAKEPIASGLKVKEGDIAEIFKENIELVSGECYIAENEQICKGKIIDFLKENNIHDNIFTSSSLPFEISNSRLHSTASNLSKIQAGITTCELLAAQTGTAILTSKEGRRLMGLSPIHLIIAKRSQLRETLDEAVKEMAKKYHEAMPSQLTLITGPSRTADIEKTLILGAHGPKRLVVFIYKN